MPEGGKLVLRTAMKAGPAGDFGVLLDVIDTGSGIAPEFLSRVFEPFFTTKKVGEGSGLGLSMVYGFVKQSDGELHIDSKVGQGTKISIWMPVTDPLEIDEKDALSDAPRSTAQRGQGQKILVVEDDPQVRAMITDMLTELGFSPTATADYDSAIGSLESNSDIQLVFTDINLGERRTGIDLMQQIAQDWPTTAVILTSGLPPEQLTESFGLDSTATVLAKPYSKEALLERLNQALA
jgi:CheY-like chemotaxis protein